MASPLVLGTLLLACQPAEIIDETWSPADDALKACVAEALELPEGELLVDDVATLEQLACPDRGIASLDGLEALTGLRFLTLWENQVRDLGPLASLTALEDLQLGNNQVADVGPLAGLTHLTRLGLGLDQLQDVSPLAALSDLVWLDLNHNQLDGDAIAALCGLSELRWLTVEHNTIADPERLACFTFDDLFYRYQATDSSTAPTLPPPPTQRPAQPPTAALPSPPWHGLSLPPGTVPTSSQPGERNTELVDLALASPNQYDAGSCLFMSGTGAMELLLSQQLGDEQPQAMGDTDLSERFLMVADEHIDLAGLDLSDFLWATDVIYLYQAVGGSLLDRDYPFYMDYVVWTGEGYELTSEDDPDGWFSATASWIDLLPPDWEERLVETPPATRTVLGLDPDLDGSSLWSVGVLDRDVVERIKHELDTKQAPVVVVYNHFSYWHANVIVGYDDAVETGGCEIVEESVDYFDDNGFSLQADAIRAHMAEQGGCQDHGAFYVRDSIYAGPEDGLLYTYSEAYGYEAPYAERIVGLPYDWVVYLGNHVLSVHRGR